MYKYVTIQLLKGIHVNMRIFVQVHHKFVSNIYLHAICLLIDMFPLPLAVGFPTRVEKCLKTAKKNQKLMLLAVFFLFSKASIFRFHVGLPRYNFNRPKSELNAAEWYWDPPTSGNKLWFEKYSDVVYHTHL